MTNSGTIQLKKLTLCELNNRAETLQNICAELDPYSPLKESDIEQLKALGFENIDDDPFRLTNQLILKMEDTLEEIQKRNSEKAPLLH